MMINKILRWFGLREDHNEDIVLMKRMFAEERVQKHILQARYIHNGGEFEWAGSRISAHEALVRLQDIAMQDVLDYGDPIDAVEAIMGMKYKVEHINTLDRNKNG